MKKRIYDVQPNAELWSYDYNPNEVYILERLIYDGDGSRAAIVRKIASYWTYEKVWKFTNAMSEYSHYPDNIVDIREFTLPID